MQIKNHKLVGARWDKARNIYGKITPEIIVVHDTASRLEKFNAANYLRDNKRGVSVQFVVETDGTITQQVPTNRRAGHAGKSTYHGLGDVNGFSIGIEIVNPGKMTRVDDEIARAWFGQIFKIKDYKIEEITTDEHGHGLWMPYTEEQITAVLAICEACFEYYPSLMDVQPHWYISPGRKIDTNPLFPLEQIRSQILGREDPADLALGSFVDDEYSPESMTTIFTPGSSLNMRRWPSFNPNVIATIPHNAIVPILEAGEFDDRKWAKVLFGGQEGWVVAKYTTEAQDFS
jgi:N-acetylmuramoyl-L-alanine amidase